MQPNPASRWRAVISLAAAATLAVIVTMVAVRVPAEAVQDEQNQHSIHAPGDHGNSFTPHTRRQVAFHDDMRKLWEDHITWTRLAIVTFADGSAGFNATAGRLLANQTDIGNAIKPFYGDAAGNQLTALLREHILIAVELLQAAKAGDTPAFEAARTRWYANANQIADFLSAANPRFWPRAEMRAAMKTHLDQTLAEAAHELGGDYAASVADYEQVHQHILDMADLLSSGIMRQFPRLFR
ncbi:MAG TPA: hypothetical protein VFC19_38985 [Candidatus Limnocylindrales bacterium]|nr:hypothetical protein [Candidatus Limnocylindrales bacterium]